MNRYFFNSNTIFKGEFKLNTIINLYSEKEKEIQTFLSKFYNTPLELTNKLEWSKEYENPIEMVDLIGAFIENNDRFAINMWVSLDPGFFINVTDHNADQIIRYLYERFPY